MPVVEPAEVPADRAYGYIGLIKEIHARDGAHAATIAAESSDIANYFQRHYKKNGIARWRAVGCGEDLARAEEYPDGPGIFSVEVIERRLFHKDGQRVRQKGKPFRFVHDVELKKRKPYEE